MKINVMKQLVVMRGDSKMDWVKLTNSGKNLEIFTASYFQTMSYYVYSNLKWLEDKEDGGGKVDIFELDIYGKIFHKNTKATILAECKRGCNFNDLFKFSGITKIVNADKNILVCESHQEKDIIKTGLEIGIDVVTPATLANTIISNSLEEHFMLFYRSNYISNKLFDKDIIKSILASSRNLTDKEKNAYNLIRKHLTFLIGDVWKTHDLAEQSKQIKSLIDNYRDFVRTVANILEIKPGNKKSEYYMRIHPLCQAAGYLMLKDRIAYIICAVECAIRNTSGHCICINRDDNPNFYDVVEELSKNIELASLIPFFLQGLIYIFGGVISQIDGSDLKSISDYLKIKIEDIRKIISLLKQLFQISDSCFQWGFVEDMGILSIKYIPYAIKGIGIINREILHYSTDDFTFKEEWLENLNLYK